MPPITRPQSLPPCRPGVYRGVREMLPRKRFGPKELLLWLKETHSYAISEQAAPTLDAATPEAKPHRSHHPEVVVVVLAIIPAKAGNQASLPGVACIGF